MCPHRWDVSRWGKLEWDMAVSTQWNVGGQVGVGDVCSGHAFIAGSVGERVSWNGR